MLPTRTEELGTILSVWAHPDDESYLSAGLMAAAIDNGQRVVCVTATRGEQGSTDPERWPAGPPLAAIRTEELAKSLAELGVTDHHWLDYPDGGCADVDQEDAVGRLRAIVEQVRPDTVLTFGPDGITYHPDHVAVSRWATTAAEGTGAQVFHAVNTAEWMAMLGEYMDPSMVMMDDREPVVIPAAECSLRIVLEGAALDRKFRAMQHQESQIGPLMAIGGPELYRRMLAEEAYTPARPDHFSIG